MKKNKKIGLFVFYINSDESNAKKFLRLLKKSDVRYLMELK